MQKLKNLEQLKNEKFTEHVKSPMYKQYQGAATSAASLASTGSGPTPLLLFFEYPPPPQPRLQ